VRLFRSRGAGAPHLLQPGYACPANGRLKPRKQQPPTGAEMLLLSLQSFSFLCLTFRACAILPKFSPHRSGRVRSAKLTGDKNMFAVWRDIAVKRSRLQFL
jgi:hypothetical protein